MSKPDGGPAYPQMTQVAAKSGEYLSGMQWHGMSLRDWFAGNIERLVSTGGHLASSHVEFLAGEPDPMLNHKWGDVDDRHNAARIHEHFKWLARVEARLRYTIADAMLAEREKP